MQTKNICIARILDVNTFAWSQTDVALFRWSWALEAIFERHLFARIFKKPICTISKSYSRSASYCGGLSILPQPPWHGAPSGNQKCYLRLRTHLRNIFLVLCSAAAASNFLHHKDDIHRARAKRDNFGRGTIHSATTTDTDRTTRIYQLESTKQIPSSKLLNGIIQDWLLLVDTMQRGVDNTTMKDFRWR